MKASAEVWADRVCVCVSGASSIRATAARAVRWPLIKSVWAEFLCADETLVRLWVRDMCLCWCCSFARSHMCFSFTPQNYLERWRRFERLKLTLTNSTVFLLLQFYFFIALWPINWTLNTHWYIIIMINPFTHCESDPEFKPLNSVNMLII